MQVFPGFCSLYSFRTQWYGCKAQPRPRQRLSESYTDCFSSSYSYLSIYSYTWVCWCFFFPLLPSPSPWQTRSLLSVFEEDAGMLTNYTNQLLQSLQRVFGAQVLSKHAQTDICKLLFPSQSVNGQQTFKHEKIKRWWTCSGWVQVSGCVFAPTVQSVSHTAFEIHWHWTLRSGCCVLWLSISQTSSCEEVSLSFLDIL